MSTLRRNAMANLVGRVATAILWIAATPFVLTRLGPEGFGIWSLFFAFNAYLLSFDLGIGHTMLRFVAAQRPQGDRQALWKTLRWGMWAALGLGLLWAGGIEVSRGWITGIFHVPSPMVPEALEALQIFGIGVLLIFPAQALMYSLQGFERIDLSNLCAALGVVVHVLFLYLNLSAGLGIRGAALAGVAGQVVAGLLAAVMVHRQLRKVPSRGHSSGPAWRDLLHFSASLQLLSVVMMLQIHSARIVVGVVGSLKMVADYELAFRVASALAGIPFLIRDPVVPAVSRTWVDQDHEQVRSMFTSTSRWVFTYSAIVLGLLWLLAPDIARVWLGAGHERIADLMRIWVLAYAANLAYSPGVAIARGMGLPRFEIMSYAAALLTNVGLAVWWVPSQGTAGAVMAVAISYVIGFLVFVATFHRGTGIFPLWPWLRHNLLPRAVAGLAAVALGALLIGSPPLADHLPPLGWAHAALCAVLFLILFALLFLPLGDTQRLWGAFRQMSGSAWTRRGGVAPS